MGRASTRLLSLASTGALVLGVLAVGSSVAVAQDGSGYGSGALYQVEISSNPPGEGIWFWAELMQVNGAKVADYQETDCIHLGGGHATDAAAHDSGEATWMVSGTTVTIEGVGLVGGLATADLSVTPENGQTYGSIEGLTLTVTSEAQPFFPLDKPLSLPATGEVAP